MENYPAIILAGGLATRMGGGDKTLLPIAGRPMLSWIVQRLHPQCAAIALNANGDPARFAAYDLPVLADSLPDHPGPLAGILAGLDWAADIGADSLVTVAGDTPFFPADLCRRLASSAGQTGLALAASRIADGEIIEHPIFGLWPVSLRDDLRSRLAAGQRRVRSFAHAHDTSHAIWDATTFDPFFNVNTPDDLAQAETLLADQSTI